MPINPRQPRAANVLKKFESDGMNIIHPLPKKSFLEHASEPAAKNTNLKNISIW